MRDSLSGRHADSMRKKLAVHQMAQLKNIGTTERVICRFVGVFWALQDSPYRKMSSAVCRLAANEGSTTRPTTVELISSIPPLNSNQSAYN